MAIENHLGPAPLVTTSIDEFHRDELVRPCRYWMSRVTDESAYKITEAIVESFLRWQLRQADENDTVKVITEGGLLSLRSEKRVGISEVEPWECAGPLVKNDIDLAFKLWLDSDTDFAKVIASYGLATVFSLVGIWSVRTVSRSSLIRLNGFLVECLLFDLAMANKLGKSLFDEHKARNRRARQSIDNARQIRNATRKQKSEETTRQYRRVALEYKQSHAHADLAAVVSYLQTLGLPKRTPLTIRRLIAGIMGEARKAPPKKTDLYSTDQRSKC